MGMKRQIYRLMAGALAAAMFCLPAMAVEEEAAVQQPSPWAYEALADSYALGMLDDNYATYIQSAVTMEQVEHLTGIVADKLALLYLPEAEAGIEPLVVDTTRGGVMNALYQEAAAYKLPGVEEGVVTTGSALVMFFSSPIIACICFAVQGAQVPFWM